MPLAFTPNTATFRTGDFREALESALDGARCGVADPSEVVAIAGRIRDGDADGWVQEWSAAAGGAWAAANSAATAGHAVSAQRHYARAATYYAAALVPIGRTSDAPREPELWRRQRECWDRAADLLARPVERIEIPFGKASLPGYFFRAPDAGLGEPRGLVVMNNGDIAPTSQMLVCGGQAAAARGYHWLVFDGPGQEAALLERGLVARVDWEQVLTAVLDAVLPCAEVDPRRLSVIGVGQGAFWVTRALCFEHRFAAAVVCPGVLDVLRAWTNGLPPAVLTALLECDREQFLREMHLAELVSPAAAAMFDRRGRQYGLAGPGRRYELFEAVSAYRLGEELVGLRTPMLIVEGSDRNPWAGQSAALQRALGDLGESLRMSDVGDGERGGRAEREALIFDWLDERMKGCRDSGCRQFMPVADP